MTPSFNYSKTVERDIGAESKVTMDSLDAKFGLASGVDRSDAKSPRFGQSSEVKNKDSQGLEVEEFRQGTSEQFASKLSSAQTYKTDPDLDLDESRNEIDELAEMGFDMGEYLGTIKPNDASNIEFKVTYDPLTDAKNTMFTMDQKDINREVQNLERLSKIELKTSKGNQNDRSSTTKLDRTSNQKVDWNMVVSWGEEWKLYDGGVYPESTVTLEGDLVIGEKDFEECLTEKEMVILRKLEVGELLDDIKEDRRDEHYHDSDEF